MKIQRKLSESRLMANENRIVAETVKSKKIETR